MDHSHHHIAVETHQSLTFTDHVNDFFSQYGFMPHGHCYLWKPWLVGVHVVSDFLIGMAYLAISLTLYGLVKRTKIGFNRIVLCFGVFIGACGLTHFMEIWNLWHSDYWWSGWVKIVTAIASVFTGIYLYRLRDPLISIAEAAKMAEAQKIELEKLLAERTEDFNSIANSIPQLAWKTDPTGFITWYNERWYEYTGTTLEEMQGWGWQKVHHPDHEARVTENWIRHLEAGKDWEDTFPLRSKSGEYRWFLSRARARRDSAGKITHWFGTNTDITDELRVKEELSQQKNLFEAVVNQMPTALVIAEAPSGKIIFGSKSIEQIWGYETIYSANTQAYNEYIGFHLDGKSVESHEWPLARSITRGEIIKGEEYQILRGKKGLGYVRLSSAPVRDNEGKIIAAVVLSEDISAEKKTLEDLKLSEEKFKTITNAMPQMIWSTLPDGFHDYYNDRWYEFTGVPYGSTDGEGWNQMFHPDDQENAWSVWKESLATGKPYEIQYRLKHKSGQYRWVLGRALPIKNEKNEIIRWMGTCTDIHEQLKLTDDLRAQTTELRQTEEKLQKAVSARDEFLSIASHELKTPLTALRLKTQVYLRQIEKEDPRGLEPSRIKNYVEQTFRHSDRLNRLVDDMLDISRIESGKLSIVKERCDFMQILGDLKERFDEQAKLETGEPLHVEGPTQVIGEWDRIRLEQVVSNLITNGLRYGKHSPIFIQVSCKSAQLHFCVIDHGAGVPGDQKEKIFDRFERGNVSPNDISGLGLGLFITKEIVAAHGGEIWVEDTAGGGATFHVSLPLNIS